MTNHIAYRNPTYTTITRITTTVTMFNMSYNILRRTWRSKTPMWFAMVFELAGVVATLVLFGIAQPDLYRTQLWRIGYMWNFNSNPNIILYSYANNQPYPDVPFVWSQKYV